MRFAREGSLPAGSVQEEDWLVTAARPTAVDAPMDREHRPDRLQDLEHLWGFEAALVGDASTA